MSVMLAYGFLGLAVAACGLVLSEQTWVKVVCATWLLLSLAAGTWQAFARSDVSRVAIPATVAVGFLVLGWGIRKRWGAWP